MILRPKLGPHGPRAAHAFCFGVACRAGAGCGGARIHEASKKLTMPIYHWKHALNRFAIMFPNRSIHQLTSK